MDAEAVRRIWQDRPTSVIVDMRCAPLDPERIVRRARNCPETHPASIIALCDDLEEADAWLDRGCTLVLERGSQPHLVAARVAALPPRSQPRFRRWPPRHRGSRRTVTRDDALEPACDDEPAGR
jgi:DNA-binding response OmpR family regulator